MDESNISVSNDLCSMLSWKDRYYKKKLELLEKKMQLQEREVSAYERIAEALERYAVKNCK